MKFANETAFRVALLKELRKIPRTLFWRMNSGTARIRGSHVQMGETGMPDICGVVGTRGLFVGIETKTETGEVSEAQNRWHTRAIERGAVVIVARPSDFADVVRRVCGMV